MASIGVIVCTLPPDNAGSPNGALVKVDGRECLLRSVELFLNQPDVAPVVVVVSPEQAEAAKQKFASHATIMGFRLAVAGPAWIDQLRAGAEKLPADVTHFVLHDAARPAVSPLDLDALLAADAPAAALVAPPPGGTLVRLDESGTLSEPTPARSLRQLVGPMRFDRTMFGQLAKGGLNAMLSRVRPIESSPLNQRVNSAADAALAKAHLALLPRPKAKSSTNPFEEAQW